jgi:nitrogen regulatory protein PII
MKAIFISFNQAYYEAIVTLMNQSSIKGFTFWQDVQGRGSKSGLPHYGSHAWPTMNSAFLVIVEEEKVAAFIEQLHNLDLETEAQGLRAFVWEIEQTI